MKRNTDMITEAINFSDDTCKQDELYINANRSVAIIESDFFLRRLLCDALGEKGYLPCVVNNAESMKTCLGDPKTAFIVADGRFSESKACRIIDEYCWHGNSKDKPLVLLLEHESERDYWQGRGLENFFCLILPFQLQNLWDIIRRIEIMKMPIGA